MKKIISTVLAVLAMGLFGSCSKSNERIDDKISAADLVVFGKIFTSENNKIVEAFAVKDGKYVYVGDAEGAASYIKDGSTTVVNHTNKGLVMPSCGNGHAHYMMGYAFETIGTMISEDDTPEKFLKEIVPAAVQKARSNNSTGIFGFGWLYQLYENNMPTRQQLDSICNDIPMYFSDEEGHKGLANTIALINAGIMKADGTVLKGGTDIRGGEIVMTADKTSPTGLLLEQAGTYVRSFMDNDSLYTINVAGDNLVDIESKLLSEGYTMYLDGWSNYFFNENFYKAAQQRDEKGDLHFILGLSHEIESWMSVSDALALASDSKKYASAHVMPQWVKLFIDGTVEGGTGYCRIPYPDGHRGIINWSMEEVADITRNANGHDLSMHIHTMGDSAVALAVDAFVAGGEDSKRNTVVHVRNVLPSTLQKMADHNITATSGMLWHQFYWLAPYILQMEGMVPEGYEDKSYPMKSFFDYGINLSSSSDFPALSGAPDDPFGIMEIAVTGILKIDEQLPWWTEELLTREQALTALTINCAKQMFIEKERGSIKVGKYADFLLVDRDVLSCQDYTIHLAKPAATYFEGKMVYTASGPQ